MQFKTLLSITAFVAAISASPILPIPETLLPVPGPVVPTAMPPNCGARGLPLEVDGRAMLGASRVPVPLSVATTMVAHRTIPAARTGPQDMDVQFARPTGH